MTHANDEPAVPASRRERLAQVLALVALLAAVVGALGPAERVRTSYSWPPEALPQGTPARVWYTPLLLMKHRPETLSASVPCTLPPPLAEAQDPVTVLASARSPDRAGGLALVKSGEKLVLSVGNHLLARVGLGGADPACAYRLSLADGRWTLAGGPQGIARSGALAEMPVVFGFFSGLDLRAGTTPTVEVLSEAHATRTITRQAVAWTFAAFALVAALLLVALERRPRPSAALRRGAHAVRANVHPVDAVVGVVLLAWWVLSPAFFDDGWILAKQSMFSTARGFSTYFVMFGTNAPLGYWLDWLQHWLTQSTSVLVVLRIPALLCLAATWVLCRCVLARVLASSVGVSSTALWGLGGAFLVGALAWGMTLRPEPVTALLVVAVLACVVNFLERGSVAPLALMAVLVPLAIAAHPSGIVALAPVLAAIPALARWVPPRLRVATTVVVASLALLTVLAFVGSDLGQRRSDIEAVRSYGGISDWRDELTRYELLSAFPYGTPLRRLTVALLALAIAAFLLRLHRTRQGLIGLPATVLTVGAILLVATPSKWPWHFGTLLALVAVAVGSETARLREARTRSRGWQVWPFLAVGAAVLAGAWAWGVRTAWNLVDLRTLDWHLGFEGRFSLLDVAILLPVLLAAGAIALAIVRRRDRRHEEPWRIASWTATVLAAPMIAFTIGVLLADTGQTRSWTLARENVEAIAGTSSCGLAEDLLVPILASARAVSTVRSDAGTPPPARLPPPPVAGLPRAFLAASGAEPTRTSWFELPSNRRFGLFVAGVPEPEDSLELEWGRRRGGRVVSLRSDEISSIVSELPDSAPWQFYAAGELPTPHQRAAVVRVTYRTGSRAGTPVAVTAPVTYSSETLAQRIAAGADRTLVHPDLLPYFPCARLPQLQEGVVEPPRYVVAAGHPALPRAYVLSPLTGLADVYEIERLATADSDDPPERVFVYEVSAPAGARRASPVATTTVS